MYNLIFHHWGLKLHLSLGKFESILSPNQTGTNILLSECPIAHFSDCHTRLLTTVTTYHQEFSIFPSLKPYSFTHFLLVASSFFPLQHLFYGFTMNSSEPLHSHTLSPLLSHTNNNQLPVCSDKVGKKIKNLNFETLPSLKQLFPGQQCWPRWLWLSHWTWHRASTELLQLPPGCWALFLTLDWSCMFFVLRPGQHWWNSIKWLQPQQKGLNVCFFKPHLGSYFENAFVATWELVLSSN